MSALGRIWAIALNTFREAVRNRVLFVLVGFVVALMAFSLVLGELSLHEEVRVIKDLGLAGISIFGLVMALFLGVNLLSKELDKKTVYAVIPKPLRRSEFFIGKYLGLVVTLCVLWVLMIVILAAFVMAEGAPMDWVLFRAEVLVLFELLLVTAVAMFFSSFSSPYLSAMLTAGIWVIGRNTAELKAFAQGKLEGTPQGQLIDAVASVIPDFRLFYISGATLSDASIVTVHEVFVTWAYVGEAALYAMTYAAVCVIAGLILFEKRDLV